MFHCKTQAKLVIMNLPAFCEIFRRFRRGVVEGMFGGCKRGFRGHVYIFLIEMTDWPLTLSVSAEAIAGIELTRYRPGTNR